MKILRSVDPTHHGQVSDYETWEIVPGATRSLPGKGCSLLWADDSGPLSIFRAAQSGSIETFVVRFEHLVLFELSFRAHRITIWPEEGVSQNTIDHLLVDQIWPRIIAHRATLVLHAAGVLTGDGAILLIGQSGEGKSTLAASFHQRGFTLLGDDAMIISDDRGEQRCRAVYPSLRLFPDSITTLFDGQVSQSDVATYTAKKNVHLGAATRSDETFPVKAVFFLLPAGIHDNPMVERVSPRAACMRMIEHSFWLDPTDQTLTIAKMAAASALASNVAAFDLSYPRDFDLLPKLHQTMLSVL